VNIKTFLAISCVSWLGATTYARQNSKLSVHHGRDHEISVAVNSQIHADYGLSYPITYQLALPQGSAELTA